MGTPQKKATEPADYLLYVDFAGIGVVEAKRAGIPLTGVEIQTPKYPRRTPRPDPASAPPAPFLYESTGVETRFTNLLEPDVRSRPVFAFHKPRNTFLN